MVTFTQTLSDLAADIRRRRVLEGRPAGLLGTLPLLLRPGVVAVMIYRISRFLVHHRLGFLHRVLVFLEVIYTKSELSPHAQVGPGLVVADCGAVGITRVAVVGKNCTFLGRNSVTLGAMEEFDVSRDRIVLGDHCVLGTGARVMRPVILTEGTQIKCNSVVILGASRAGSTLAGIPAKRRSSEDLDQIRRWNPLRGGYLEEA